ncbi:hypothetical protein [Priestia koreensis]|uniref:hypothetical protein n=1 Tax=Priestia koreensis TaxID=284581 RepID=UPI00203DCDE4|nr:hypothetical protein [Priestia koreensis]MCM3003236.1 hypothetical protein [Priestia koreensis]
MSNNVLADAAVVKYSALFVRMFVLCAVLTALHAALAVVLIALRAVPAVPTNVLIAVLVVPTVVLAVLIAALIVPTVVLVVLIAALTVPTVVLVVLIAALTVPTVVLVVLIAALTVVLAALIADATIEQATVILPVTTVAEIKLIYVSNSKNPQKKRCSRYESTSSLGHYFNKPFCFRKSSATFFGDSPFAFTA